MPGVGELGAQARRDVAALPRWKSLVRSSLLTLQQGLHVRPRGFCMVLGCPRSGTSATSRWINRQRGTAYASQSRTMLAVHRFLAESSRFKSLHAGEPELRHLLRDLVYRYYSGFLLHGRGLLVDKENLEPVAFPGQDYRAFVETVLAVMPEVKLLFMIRDPVATVWSMTQRQWGQSLTSAELRTYSVEESTRIWNAAAEVIAEYGTRDNAYVCPFDRLVRDPVGESRRILGFLGLRGRSSFEPRTPRPLGLDEAGRNQVLTATERLRTRLLAPEPGPAA